jgi:hypothetical protein
MSQTYVDVLVGCHNLPYVKRRSNEFTTRMRRGRARKVLVEISLAVLPFRTSTDVNFDRKVPIVTIVC